MMMMMKQQTRRKHDDDDYGKAPGKGAGTGRLNSNNQLK